MIVFDRHVLGVAIIPPETDSPLVVHSDAVFFVPFARKFLEVVAWWGAQVIDRRGRMEHEEFSIRPLLDVCRYLS